ncbi:MAG: replicative DNA helicase [Chitinophagales bacterium]|nr:replicative DNA helicase [Chitinophagales bacterium]MBP9845805.1 replicative DNA helicase [Saprospiraceae bacterium]
MEINNKQDRKTKRKPSLDLGNMVFGKMPPQCPEIEAAVLGAIMLDRTSFDICAEIIRSECFYTDANQKIYSAMESLSAKNLPTDMLTLVEELKRKEELDLVGGPYYIAKLTNSVVSSANIETHARIIMEKHIQRELIRIGGETVGDAYEDSTDAFELLAKTDQKITEITMGNLKKTYCKLSSSVVESIHRIEELRALGRSITGIPSNLKEIDKLTHGWQSTDLIILAARPSVGKTAFALNLARAAASNEIKPVSVAFFSMEMQKIQLTNRMLSSESEVPLEQISTGQITDDNLKRLYTQGSSSLDKLKIFLDDSHGLTIQELTAKARNLKRKEKIGMIIIDYLQLMGSSNNKIGNREQEISKISRDLKGLAKELEVPIIALSQLSRETEKRKGEAKMPQLSDLRESGAIEQDADVVMMMYRPEYYDIKSTEMGESNKGETHIRFAKNRNGVLGVIKLRADLSIQKFNDWDGDQFTPDLGPGTWRPVNFHDPEDKKDGPF